MVTQDLGIEVGILWELEVTLNKCEDTFQVKLQLRFFSNSNEIKCTIVLHKER